MPHFLDLISPQIQRAGRLHTRKWKGLKRINYDQQLIFVKEGSIRTRFDGFSHDNEINTYILKPSGLQHRTEQTSSGAMQLYWVHFNWVYAEVPPNTPTVCYHTKDFNPAFLRSAPDYTPREVISGEVSNPVHVHQLFMRLYHRWNFGTAAERASCRGVLLELLIELLGKETRYHSAQPNQPNDDPLAYKIQQMLHNMLDNPRTRHATLESILGSTGYSYSYLSRLFRKKFGVSPLVYLNKMKIDRAKTLLADTLLPINEVAHEVGVDNAAYFSRLFSRECGCTPGKYRDQISRASPH